MYTQDDMISRSRRNSASYIRTNGISDEVSKREKRKFNFKDFREGLDVPFCIMIFVLLAVGIVMMFSASYVVAYYEMGDSYYYLKRQILFAIIAIIVMLIFSYVDYHRFHKFAPIVLIISYAALILVLFIPNDGGPRRWIGIGTFGIQASEITKFAVILFLAHWGSKYHAEMNTFKRGVLPAILLFVSTSILLIAEPHYSCIAIILLLTIVMLFVSGVEVKWFIIGGVAIGIVLIILAATGLLSYAMTRMEGWGQALNYVDENQWQQTWQTRNSLYAIGSGGLFGLGLGQSRQKYLYLPEPQNDFVFAIICEELGLIGAIIVLVLFALLVWRGIVISLRAPDRFGKLLGIGLTSQIGIQVILNILVITDWLPNTGISLPFFSYGGSSLIMLLFEMGIVLSVGRAAKQETAPVSNLKGRG